MTKIISVDLENLNIPKSLTESDVESVIQSVHYNHLKGSTLTICVIKTNSGFTVTGTSACVNPDAYDEEVGEELAYKQAFEKLWEFEAYLLKYTQYQLSRAKKEREAMDKGVPKELSDLLDAFVQTMARAAKA